MPIIFVSNNIKFIDIIKSQTNYESHHIVIQDYIPKRKTYYVSPANSLCFMDGGIDLALSRIIMPGIERKVKEKMCCGQSASADYINAKQRWLRQV
jgi:hypothetical protein